MGGAGLDPTFDFNARGALRSGIEVASYHLLRPETPGEKQADYYTQHLRGYPQVLPLCVDVEPVLEPLVDLTQEQYALLLLEFIKRVRRLVGKYPVIYTGPGAWSKLIGNYWYPEFLECELWVAHYTDQSNPLLPGKWKKWSLWQYSSSETVKGIDDDGVDVNRKPPPIVVGFRLTSLPTRTGFVTQIFGGNTTGDDDFYSKWGLPGHDGIDYRAKKGDPIFAAAPGRVTLVAIPGQAGIVPNHAYGKHIKVDHRGGAYTSQYCHLSEIATGLVVGKEVAAGEIIGYAGNTGNVISNAISDGTHLHFMLRKKGATDAGEKQQLADGTWAVYPKDIVNPAPYF